MEREFTYTKDRLREIITDLVETDVMNNPLYRAEERAVEGFEKRAALDFVLWFVDQAFPDSFCFRCNFDKLHEEYGAEVAEAIVRGPEWSTQDLPEDLIADNVVYVDFSRRK